MEVWKEIKDEYAREQGYENWNDLLATTHVSTSFPVTRMDTHLDAVSLLRAKQALENAESSAERAAFKERSLSRVYLKMYEAIKDENNIPL